MGPLRLPRFAVVAYAAAIGVLVATWVASIVLDRSLEDLTQDPTETLDAPAYIGFLASVGALLWAAATAVCLLAWWGTGGRTRSPFLFGGGLCAILLADDVFRLHESFYPSLGVGSRLAATVYAVMTLAYAWSFREFVLRWGAYAFAAALVLLGTSAATDELLEERAPYVFEEGAKILGILTLALFFGRAALGELRAAAR